ncbi:DUF4149 domain-containing protein [Malikia sp.]|uniref:DUF4149 domain-containing protein n=1 Tax=Malikia sp. TaxID=2070706 RepID=UPI0026309501|nr:DUF4149 domain-containing protein [Malikia sp.]MDD2728369.1 DUF4149 domain-containing protein [Malikia sp.]
MLQRWPLLLAALWSGGLSALSFVAVPLAFAHFGNPALAGPYAARLFQIQSWSSLVVALLLLVWVRARAGFPDWKASYRALLPWLLVAACAALLQEWGVAPRIQDAQGAGADRATWHHRAGVLLVLLQCLCAWRALGLLAFSTARLR